MADIEGAFLQGHEINREGGKVYVQLPKEGVPGLRGDEMVEIEKYVYGLDAPRQWWLRLSAELEKLGARSSILAASTGIMRGGCRESLPFMWMT